MVVVPGIVHMPGIHIMPARLISPHWRRGWRRVYRTGRECLCPGLCRHCCADRRYTEHRGRSCCNHMLAHFQPPDVSFDDEMSISNTAHHNQGGTEPVARPLIQRYRQGASFRHSRVRRIRYPPGGRIHPMRPLPFSRQVTANRRFTDNRLSRARARVDARSLRLPQRIIRGFVQTLYFAAAEALIPDLKPRAEGFGHA
jgi:hypothetical protein